jgi:nucleoside-diphosphate-sugar epimerase
MSRIVLFGSIGFVGSNLLAHLPELQMVTPSLEEANLTDLDSLRRTIQPDDCLINAAGFANATDTSPEGRALCQALNIDGVTNLARAAADCGAAQLIHLSSVAAMGRWYGTERVSEEMLRPDETPYASSKRQGEIILAGFQDRLPITILRPTSVFGEGRGLAVTMCKLAARGVVPLPGGGMAKIPFTYIGNMAHAIALCINNPACFNRTFIIGDVHAYPLRDIVLAFAKAQDTHPRLVPVPVPLVKVGVVMLEVYGRLRKRPPLLDRWRLGNLINTIDYSIAAFQAATGYVPRYSLDDAAARIVAWYREQEK